MKTATQIVNEALWHLTPRRFYAPKPKRWPHRYRWYVHWSRAMHAEPLGNP